MFGLGMPEILMILALALIVIGPKKLPELAKTLGRAMGEFKRSAQDFKRSIDIETTVGDINPPASTDLRKVVKDANKKSDPETADPDKDDEKKSRSADNDPPETKASESVNASDPKPPQSDA
jgi:Tat protein translocase TatB subunit